MVTHQAPAMKYLVAASILVLCATAISAAPAPIYRCGPDGREYSQVPCADGKLIDASDPRSADQRSEALKVAARERQRAAELERERRENAAAIKPASASGFNARPSPPASVASSPGKGQRKKRHTKVKPIPDTVAAKPATKPATERKRKP